MKVLFAPCLSVVEADSGHASRVLHYRAQNVPVFAMWENEQRVSGWVCVEWLWDCMGMHGNARRMSHRKKHENAVAISLAVSSQKCNHQPPTNNMCNHQPPTKMPRTCHCALGCGGATLSPVALRNNRRRPLRQSQTRSCTKQVNK